MICEKCGVLKRVLYFSYLRNNQLLKNNNYQLSIILSLIHILYSSIGYLNEKGYVKATGYERFSGRINTTYTPNKWFKGCLLYTSQTQEVAVAPSLRVILKSDSEILDEVTVIAYRCV